MTEVLSISQPNGMGPFGSPVRRSTSQASFFLQNPPSYPRTKVNHQPSAYGYDATDSSTPSSPALNHPDFSRRTSYDSTPSSSLSFDEPGCDEEEDYFPSYGDDDDCLDDTKDPNPPSSPDAIDSATTTHSGHTPVSSSALSRSHLFDSNQTTGDDMAVRGEPTRHVDYLSHTWREEDIWASWRHVVGRKNLYSNGPRLENASWRTWAKAKYGLKTISPEALNWMKDHDVTWLYGPLQFGSSNMDADDTPPVSQMSRSNSFGLKKPILKKRSMSEVMLQRSLSSSTLMKQATDALRAQQSERKTGDPSIPHATKVSDFISLSGSESETPLTRGTTHAGSSNLSSPTSGNQTPSTGRHIHFNNKVEQCIAINCESGAHHSHLAAFDEDDESSEDDMLTIQPVKSQPRRSSNQPGTPRDSFSNESRIIAKLPSTTLNCRGDSPNPETQNAKAKIGSPQAGMHASASQHTLRPSTPGAGLGGANFLVDEDEDDADINWQPPPGRRGSYFPQGGFHLQPDVDEEEQESLERQGLRRTASGMFMPFDEEDEVAREGLLGKVVDTVNTARDIAHVIWNVGWRG